MEFSTTKVWKHQEDYLPVKSGNLWLRHSAIPIRSRVGAGLTVFKRIFS